MERPQVGIPKDRLSPNAIARWARETPDQIAVQQVDGPAFTYRELDRTVRTWAGAFRRLGVTRGEHVATMLPNGFLAQRAWNGLAWLGALEVPVNPAHQGPLLHYTLHQSDTTTLVIAAEFIDRLGGVAAELPSLKRVVLLGDGDAAHARALPFEVVTGEALLEGAEPADDLPGPIYRDLAAMLYTSGTTGPSKGVLVPWALLYGFWSWVPEDALRRGEAVYCPFPLVHNSGRSCFNSAMARGARFVFRERFSATSFWDDVRRTDCQTATLVGPMTALLASQPRKPDDADTPLRSIICGPLPPDIEAFKKRFGVELATCYGMTEIGIVVTTDWNHGPWQNCGRERTDYPWPEVRIVDENDEPVAPGSVGELIVRSAEPWALNAGYYKMPEKTAEAWRNGWFHTGDAFRQDEHGWYYLVDRMKDSIRRRGENISSFEVETIVRGYPGVGDCAAIAVPAALGEDEVMVVIETADPRGLSPESLVEWLEPRMPRFMLPRYVDLVPALPRNATTQRVKKHELRERGVTETTWDRLAGA
jgi:crotonobetaine/carnitine-CoA ligase